MKPITISTIGIDFLDDVEGRNHKEYPDVEGNPTIGIGHLLTRSELTSGKLIIKGEVVRFENGITDKQMDDLFVQDIAPITGLIVRMVKVDLTQYQFDSLISFVYNVGDAAFITSTLLRTLNDSQYSHVPFQMRRWNKIREKGKLVVCEGLVNRRNLDVSLWENKWRIRYAQ